MNLPCDHPILIVDDDPIVSAYLADLFDTEGWQSLTAHDGKQALAMLGEKSSALLLLDYELPDMTGIEVLSRARALDPAIPAILISAQATVEITVQAMRAGALDCMEKPICAKRLVDRIRGVLEKRTVPELGHQPWLAGTTPDANHSLVSLMGTSRVIRLLAESVQKVAKTRFNVLIAGETGTGKELVAHALHRLSRYASGPFVAVDCGALPEHLLESELFGHERGAFTGAVSRRTGKFELAQGGTLFLDEISNLTWTAQASLLRAIQERVIVRVGGHEPIPFETRIIAACNQDLVEAVDRGSFRQDLYFRLCEFVLRTPPLSERTDDILFLAERFLTETNHELGKEIVGISEPAQQLLLAHPWPGNVRELRNVIRQAVLQADEEIDTVHLTIDRRRRPESSPVASTDWNGSERRRAPQASHLAEIDAGQCSMRTILRRHTAVLERELVAHAMCCSHGNKQRAAQMLSVDYKTLLTKVKEYAIGEADWSHRSDYRGFLETLRGGEPVD